MCRNDKVQTWNPNEYFNPELSTSPYVVMILNRPITVTPQGFVLKLWRKASLRVTVDGGTNSWLSWLKLNNLDCSCSKVAPDLITGDMDSLEQDVLDYFINKNQNIKVIKTPDQSETDFTKALREIHQHITKENLEIDSVIVVCDSSGRFDHILANINSLFKARTIIPNVKVILLATNSLTWLLDEGVTHTINIPPQLRQSKKWCALIPIGSSCRVISTGLKWNLSNSLLEFGKLVSTSNTYNGEPFVTVKSDNPIMWSMGINNC